MPRLTEVLMHKKPLKKFTNYRYEHIYKQVLPPVLKNKVSSKGDRKKVAPCLQEISQMLVCLRENDFNQGLCSREIEMFDKCQQEFKAFREKKIEAESKGMMTSSAGGRVNSKQLNELLRRFPQPS